MKQRMIEVTEADILTARQEQGRGVGHSLTCPIAQALKRAFTDEGAISALVDYDTADVYRAGDFALIIPTTEPMRRLMRGWDGQRVRLPDEFKDSIEDILSQLQEDENGCLVWPYALSHGYGFVYLPGGGPSVSVHRLAWTFINGPVEEAMDLHHTCENKRCANVEHLQLLTPSEHAKLHPRPKVERPLLSEGHRKSVRFADDVYEAIAELAYGKRVSVNTEIGKAVEHWLGLTEREREEAAAMLPVREGQQFHESRKAAT